MKKTILAMLMLAAHMVPVSHANTNYPDKPVKIIIPQAPGGASDALARLVAQGLSETWGQSVIVENRAGAGGNIGLDAAARSAPDGYTLLFSYEGTQAINVSLRTLPFDPVNDFTMIATVATVPFIVTVNKDIEASTFNDFINLSKSRQNMTFGSAGSGTVNHLLGEMVNRDTGADLTHIPYKGAAPALTDLLGGRIDAVYTSVPSIAAHIEAGSVKALAITSNTRSSRFPDIPTLAESGAKDFHVAPWFGLLGPAGIPDDIVQKINHDVNALLDTPEMQSSLAQHSAEPMKISPQEMRDLLISDIEKWAVVVKSSGAKVD